MKNKLNLKEKRILLVIIGIWGLFLLGSGLIMNSQIKPIINTEYSLEIEKNKISEAQAKTNEIKLKDIEIEVNNPISVDVKDYLENVEKISESTINALKLDTSLVNINEAGTYQYTITYKKKKYIAKITVKEKELPNVSLTLKTLKLKTGDALSTNPRSYINENISDEVYNNLFLDLSQVNNQVQGNYKYYITYKNTKYEGTIEIKSPGPTIKTPSQTEDEKTDTDKSDDKDKDKDKE